MENHERRFYLRTNAAFIGKGVEDHREIGLTGRYILDSAQNM